MRAYRVGQARFTRLLVGTMMENRGSTSIDGPASWAVEQVSGYIDRVVGQVLHAYEASARGSRTGGARRPCVRS